MKTGMAPALSYAHSLRGIPTSYESEKRPKHSADRVSIVKSPVDFTTTWALLVVGPVHGERRTEENNRWRES